MSITFRELPDGYGVRAEVDLMEEARKRISRKIEIDGERALELALAEAGYVKERTCKNLEYDPPWFTCSGCGFVSVTEWLACGSDTPNYCPNCGAKVVSE